MIRIIDTVGCLLVDDTCKETARRRKENGEDAVKNFKYELLFD